MRARCLIRRFLRACALCASLACAAVSVGAAQGVTPTERSRAHVMLKQVREQIERYYLDTTWRGIDLQAQFRALDERIAHGTSLGELLATVAQLPLALDDSHTFFVPPEQTTHVDYGWDALSVGESVYVRQVKPGSDAERQGVRPGDLVLAMNGHHPTRRNLWLLSYLYRFLRPQRGLHVVVQAPGSQPRELDLAANVSSHPRILDLTGRDGGSDIARLLREGDKEARDFESLLVEAGGGVLVWRLPTFDVSRETIDRAQKAIRHDSALVLDLRGNQGGGVAQLLAITRMLNRDDVTLGVQRERTRSEPMVAKGSGGDAFTGRVVVLVDSRSASASEILARVVQLTHRGIVLGDLTAGSVMRSRFHLLRQGMEDVVIYGVNVADADVVMTDGRSLEGVGVAPDTLVIPTAGDLAAGRDPVLARALTMLGLAIDARAAGALLKP